MGEPATGRLDADVHCDVLVVGGGINGTGIARDLAGRGWKVLLCERDDLAQHTSSASTKLIHGGLRYLEHREFALVRKSLQERERLLTSAPHIMWPLEFVMPHDPALRPAWLIRLGLLLYDHLAPRERLAASRTVDLRHHVAGAALQPRFSRGFVYGDGWVDDARLVVLCAIDARERGATILTRTACTAARRGERVWSARLRGAATATTVQARALVNATGPWAEGFLRGVAQPLAGEALATRRLRLVKGSHIVVPRCFAHEHAYLLQGADRRIVFALPYERDFTLIGTTDVELHGEPGAAHAEPGEIAYLCEQANRYFARPIKPADAVWSYAGVRPLLDDADVDPSAVTRDYLLETRTDGAPLLTVWGGKITTFRKLAEEAADAIGRLLGERRARWTANATLPGGELSAWTGSAAPRGSGDFERFVAEMARRRPWLPAPLAHRLARAYGTRCELVLGEASSLAGLGDEIVPGLHAAELEHLVQCEWAASTDDVLWRRSKLGLHVGLAGRAAVQAWLSGQTTASDVRRM